ncbi:MAG: CapA family protein, partial [Patescibacteria group bacterium]
QADQLGLQDTYFDDSSGLSPNNQSTTADLFKLAGYINQKRADLFEITTKGSYSNARHNWSSNNQFLRAEGYLGGKSGFTDPALESVVSLFSLPLSESGTRNIAITLLRSEDRYKDVNNILKFLKNNIYYGGEGETDATWIKQKEGVPEIKDPDFATLSFLGDMMLDRGVKNSVMKNFGGDYSTLFEHLEDLKKSDAVFANLEGTASDLGEDLGSLYSFRMDPSVVPALSGAGINVLSVANNHVGDFGREAYADTLSRLRENEILYTGGGENLEEAEEPATMQYYGIKIGFLGFADNGPRSMEARADTAGFLPANTPRFDEIIQNASKQVDYLVVSFHFGEEYQSTHNERQEYLAHRAIDNGAKIVVGHHPHVMQDTEIYSPKDCTQSSCVGYIAYSLGNFIFDQRFNPEVTQGLWLEVKLAKDGNMAVNKNIIKSNNVFQPDKIIKGKEEKIKFDSLTP